MLSEIGSNFWISPDDIRDNANLGTPDRFGLRGSDFVWLSTGRSATKMVLDTIERRNPELNHVAIIPPFTCHTVIEPFIERGYKIITHPIINGLNTDASLILSLADEVNAGVILFHRYFGFDTISNINAITKKLQSKRIVVIEDCTQCLYSNFEKSPADFFVASIRKWCGVPDGGFAVCKEDCFDIHTQTHDVKLQETKYTASKLKYDYMFLGKDCKPESKLIFRDAENILDNQIGFFSISPLSALIQTNLDVKYLVDRRRNNYQILNRSLSDIKGISILFPKLPSTVTPLYLPILVEDRESIQSKLADNDIYAPVVWPKADCCPPVDNNTEYIYNHILCIPIDQRYDIDDMNRVVKVLKN